jgi:hypothetical protein
MRRTAVPMVCLLGSVPKRVSQGKLWSWGFRY